MIADPVRRRRRRYSDGMSSPPRRGSPRDAAGAARSSSRNAGPARAAPAPRTPRRTSEEVSAGGIALRSSEGVTEAALIGRLTRGGRLEWCLPKGHLEGSETAREAAVREIAEETGIIGEVVASLGSIDYWFSVAGRRVHKTVHHYLVRATGGSLTVEHDPDAEAVEAAWVPLADLEQRLAYANERRIAAAAAALLADGR